MLSNQIASLFPSSSSIHPSIKKHTYRCSDRPLTIDYVVLMPQGLPKLMLKWSQGNKFLLTNWNDCLFTYNSFGNWGDLSIDLWLYGHLYLKTTFRGQLGGRLVLQDLRFWWDARSACLLFSKSDWKMGYCIIKCDDVCCFDTCIRYVCFCFWMYPVCNTLSNQKSNRWACRPGIWPKDKILSRSPELATQLAVLYRY